MSLIRQIWLLLLGSLLLSFICSIALGINSARGTFEAQLRMKNSDNAVALAQVLSQQEGDQVRMELLMRAQFDTGFYKELRLLAPQGETLFLRQGQQTPLHAPGWFVNLVAIELEPGEALVSSAWRQIGSVRVISHSAYVYDALWSGTLKAAATLALVMILATALAAALVKRIKSPLDQAVKQAQALVNGEFVTIKPSDVPELSRLTLAMNSMVVRLRSVFEAQALQVESFRQQALCDALTGISNRKHFLGQLSARMQSEDGPKEGGLVLLRILDLAEANLKIGREATDHLITTISDALRSYTERAPGCHLGRLNGADFGLYLPVGGVALETGTALVQVLRSLLPALGPTFAIAIGAVEITQDSTLAQVLSAADNALARAESRTTQSVELDAAPIGSPAPQGQDAWRLGILNALVTGRAKLVTFPLIDPKHELIQFECPLRLRLGFDRRYEAASRWLPLAVRSRLTPMVDERAVSLAISAITQDNMPRCVHLCAASLRDPNLAHRLRSLVERFPAAAQHLFLEVAETAAIDNFDRMLELGRELRPLGVRLGLEHAGERLSQFTRLLDAKLHFIKLDGAVVQGVASDTAQKDFVRSVVSMLHGLALQVYAEGVIESDDAEVLFQLGVDGITGPWASSQRPDCVRDADSDNT